MLNGTQMHPLPPQRRAGAAQEDKREREPWPYLNLARSLALLFAGLVGLSAFWGLRHLLAAEGGLSSWLIAGCLGVVLAALLAGAWHMLLSLAATVQQDAPKIAKVIAGGLGLTGVQIATTSWFLATAIGGGAALQVHQTAHLNQLASIAAYVQQRSEQDRGILSALSQTGGALQGLVACEERRGCLSGQIGSGPVTAELGRLAQSFERGRQEFETALNRRPTLLADVRDQLDRAHLAVRSGDEEAFGTAVNTAIAGLSGARAADPLQGLSGFEDQSAWPEVQAVLSRLRGTLGTAESLAAAPVLSPYTPLDRASAVIEYADEVAFAWVIAVVIDALPFTLLLLVLLAGHLRSAPAMDPPMTGTVGVEHDTQAGGGFPKPWVVATPEMRGPTEPLYARSVRPPNV